jgi:hypothetical protein
MIVGKGGIKKMNPDKNKLEPIYTSEQIQKHFEECCKHAEKQRSYLVPGQLYKADGSPVPEYWPIFDIGETVVLKNYSFRIEYIGEETMLLKPLGIVEIGKDKSGTD